ncbi:hypothetical protein [Algoriphagus aquimarinus]|uniref:hypothetical protein n=1 Tax=Algoriphagus aquimarinus TaxID=237018 RepID=UPI0030D8BC56|tara:strand:- start:3654 stop:4001 length:348 start_codon:yes stop_codon:yes gene_type:complete
MRVSVILPVNSNTEYLEAIYLHIRQCVPALNLAEIIQVQELDDRRLVKIAEKAHACLYLFENPQLFVNLRQELSMRQVTYSILYCLNIFLRRILPVGSFQLQNNISVLDLINPNG